MIDKIRTLLNAWTTGGPSEYRYITADESYELMFAVNELSKFFHERIKYKFAIYDDNGNKVEFEAPFKHFRHKLDEMQVFKRDMVFFRDLWEVMKS